MKTQGTHTNILFYKPTQRLLMCYFSAVRTSHLRDSPLFALYQIFRAHIPQPILRQLSMLEVIIPFTDFTCIYKKSQGSITFHVETHLILSPDRLPNLAKASTFYGFNTIYVRRRISDRIR